MVYLFTLNCTLLAMFTDDVCAKVIFEVRKPSHLSFEEALMEKLYTYMFCW